MNQPFVPKPLIKGSINTMVMGIISISLCWICYIPFFSLLHCLATLIMGIYAVADGNRIRKEYEASEPGVFSHVSLGFAKTAVVTGTLGIIFSAICLIPAVLMSLVPTHFFNMYRF